MRALIDLLTVSSIFRRENEVMLLLKTRAEHLERLKLRILEIHPYEVPEVIAIPVESGYRAYLEWIAAETK